MPAPRGSDHMIRKRSSTDTLAGQRSPKRRETRQSSHARLNLNGPNYTGAWSSSPPPLPDIGQERSDDDEIAVKSPPSRYIENAAMMMSPVDSVTQAATSSIDSSSSPIKTRASPARPTVQRSSLPLPFRRTSRASPTNSPKPKLWYAVQRVREHMVLSRTVSLWKTHRSQECLCEDCDKLDLNYGSFVVSSQGRAESNAVPTSMAPSWRGPSQGKKTLGTLRQIFFRSDSCPLCRLIVRSLAEQKQTWLARIVANEDGRNKPEDLDTTINDLDAVCEVSWHVDGREWVEDEEGGLVDVPCTRRLRIQWPKSSYAEAYLVLMFPDTYLGPRNLFLGRYLTSIDDSKVDQIRKWYKLCLEGHAQTCSINYDNDEFEDLRSESYFGVVDVQHMQLTCLPKNSPYAALSYTWGKFQTGEQRFKTTIHNIDRLKQPGGVQDVEDQLPKTITDSINLVRALGMQYLWVDSLCILQDDEELWELNASKMDTVYGNASLTICAADGEDAHCGLKALDPLPSKYEYHAKQYIEKIKPNLHLMVAYPSETYVSRSVWNTRAWTFQERVLSKRCLIFTEGRVYFQCRSATMSEDIHAEDPQAGWSIELLHGPLQRYKNLNQQPVDVYKYSVLLYTSRGLTKEEDILAAFSGISKEICLRLGGEPIYGLPNSHFDFALLWKPDNAPERRKRYGKLRFPSWSWCGWKHARMTYSPSIVDGCELNLHEWLMNHTWITWYIRDGRGNLRLVWDPSLHCKDVPRIESRWQGYCNQIDGNHGAGSINQEYEHPTIDRYQRTVRESVKTRPRDTFYRTMPKYPYQVRMVEPGKKSASAEERLDDQRFLQFWTWSAFFCLVPEDQNQPFSKRSKGAESNLVRFGIQDDQYNLVGTITLGKAWAEEGVDLSTPHEFIAISEGKGFAEDEMKEWSFIEPSLPGQTEWYVYNVLMLVYDDEIQGVARRAGLGKIYKRGFDTAILMPDRKKKKEWREIILG